MLTDEQRNIIENSMWVVNTALKKEGLPKNNDLRQSALLYMCELITKYDPSYNVKWETFAYKNVVFFIKKSIKKEKADKFFLVGKDIEDCLYVNVDSIECEKCVNGFSVSDIGEMCNEKEKSVLELKRRGYTASEIGKILKVTPRRVTHYMRSIKEKSREASKQ